MMVRIGVVYGLSVLAGILVAVALVKAALAIWGDDPKTGLRRFGLKVSLGLALLLLLALPVVLSTCFGKYVWVIDDGNRFRRYLLYAAEGTAETLDGKPLKVSIGPGKAVETVVNGTSRPVVVESVQYGGVVTVGKGFRKAIEPGASLSLDYPLDDVQEPPDKLKVTNGVGFRIYAYQVK